MLLNFSTDVDTKHELCRFNIKLFYYNESLLTKSSSTLSLMSNVPKAKLGAPITEPMLYFSNPVPAHPENVLWQDSPPFFYTADLFMP